MIVSRKNNSKGLSSTIILIGFTISLAMSAGADATADARKSLEALYARANAAASRKDAVGVTAIDTPNYSFVDSAGKSHKLAELTQTIDKLFLHCEAVQVTTRIDSVTLHGKSATVQARQHQFMRYSDPKTRRIFLVDQRGTVTDYWIKQDTVWRRVHSQVHEARTYVNGRLVKKSPVRSGDDKARK